MFLMRYPASLDDPEAEGYVYFATVFSPAQITRLDWFPPGAMAGTFPDDEQRPEDFEVNPAFIWALHWVVAHYGAEVLEQQLARGDDEGRFVFVTDLRSGLPSEEAPIEDRIGYFEILAQDDYLYHGNSDYRLYTEAGPAVLPEWVISGMLAEIERRMSEWESSQ